MLSIWGYFASVVPGGSDRSGFGTFFGSKLMIVRSLVDVDFLSNLRNMSN